MSPGIFDAAQHSDHHGQQAMWTSGPIPPPSHHPFLLRFRHRFLQGRPVIEHPIIDFFSRGATVICVSVSPVCVISCEAVCFTSSISCWPWRGILRGSRFASRAWACLSCCAGFWKPFRRVHLHQLELGFSPSRPLLVSPIRQVHPAVFSA